MAVDKKIIDELAKYISITDVQSKSVIEIFNEWANEYRVVIHDAKTASWFLSLIADLKKIKSTPLCSLL